MSTRSYRCVQSFFALLCFAFFVFGDLDVSMRSGETHDERMERESHSWHASSSQEEEQEQEGNRKRGSRRRRRSGGGGGSASLVKKSSLYESMRADGHPAAERTDRPPDWYASMRWGKRFLMILGSSGLACLGGIINGIAVGGVFPLGLTHLTSTTTYAGVIAVAPQLDFKGVELWFCAVITLCFIAGASITGFVMTDDRRSRWDLPQGFLLLVEACGLWGAFVFSSDTNHEPMSVCLAFASGLQFDLTLVRTINMTALFTDFGLSLGHSLRYGFAGKGWFLLVVGPLLLSFFGGASLGYAAFERFGRIAILFPSCLTSAASLLTILFCCRSSSVDDDIEVN